MAVKHRKHYFVLNLDVADRPCLVVGGDDEALEKTLRLVECRAKVTLVSPKVLPDIQAMVRAGKIRHLGRRYKAGDEEGMYFVINCVKTDPEMSKTLYDGCVRRGALISSYDQPEFSMATMASLLRAGKIRLSIASNGTIPAVARKLRMELEKILDRRFAEFVDWVCDYRERMVGAGVSPEERRKRLRALMADFQLEGSCRYPKSFEQRRRPD